MSKSLIGGGNITKREKLISCIGINFIHPIIELSQSLGRIKFTGSSRLQVSSKENGYSISIIVLLILLIESVLNRVRYIKKHNKKDNLRFFKNEFSNKNLTEKLYEVYVVRDLIVHNYLWQITYKFDNSCDEKQIYRKLLLGCGDKKYAQYVDKKRKITKKLKINVIPTKISKTDVKKIFEVTKELFIFLEQKDKRYFPISNFHFKYNGRNIEFYKIVDSIRSSL